MVANKLYIVAISMTTGIVALVTGHTFLIILLFFWLAILLSTNRINYLLFILSVMALSFSYFFIPSPEQLNKQSVTYQFESPLTGRIISQVSETNSKLEFTFQARVSNEKVIVSYFKKTDEVSERRWNYGARCSITGEIKQVDQATNPYQFDYRQYLLTKGITHQLNVKSLTDIQCENTNKLLAKIYKLHTYLIDRSTDKLDKRTVGWFQSLILGDKQLLDKQVMEVFQDWGLSHILAISGLHVGIIVSIIYVILVKFQLLTKEKAQIIILLFLPFYAILVGGQPSVWRASLMVVLVITFHKLKLKISYLDILSLVYILLILSNPLIIYHIGFQFSFAVTFSLIISSQLLQKTNSRISQLLIISFIAQMAIIPLQLHYFYLFQPLSIIVNLVIVPYFSCIVIPYMFILFAGLFLPEAILTIVERMFIFFHEKILQIIYWTDQHLNFPFTPGQFSIYYAILYYVLFLLLMFYLEKGKLDLAFRYGCFIVCLFIFLSIRPYISPIGSVTMLDIGQGDAFIIELPYRKSVFIIDAGATFSFTDFLPKEKVYQQIIKPYLLARGIRQINTIFVSHEHVDHDGSIRYILKDFSVEEIVLSNYYNQDENVTLWKGHSTKITVVKFSDKIIRGEQTFHVLSPQYDQQSANENSLVLYTELGGKKWLFTGDVGKVTEREIMRQFPNLAVDVLKVGHHGSNTSTDASFLAQIKADYSLISVGRGNRYGHPTEEVIATLREEGSNVLRTDEMGAIQYIYRGDSGYFTRVKEVR